MSNAVKALEELEALEWDRLLHEAWQRWIKITAVSGKSVYLTKEQQDVWQKQINEAMRQMLENLNEVSGGDDCNHDWKSYTGLQDVYDYCISCDKKR